KICHEQEAIVRRDRDCVCMRFALTLAIHTRSLMLDECRSLAQRSIRPNRERRDAAAIVVCRKHPLAAFVQRHMAWSRSPGRPFVQQAQLAGPRVDRKSTDAARGFSSIRRGLVNSIDDALVWMNRQEGRILGLSGHADQSDLAGCRIESA